MDNNILYSKEYLWIKKDGDTARIGLTEYAIKKMKTIVFLNLPDSGDDVTIGEVFGDIESLKTVSDLISPVTGCVESINEDLADEPDTINDSVENSWLIEVKTEAFSEELMNEAEYLEFIGSDTE